MYKMTDLLSLGAEYTVSGPNEEILKVIQVITQDDILDAALGPYNDKFDSYDSYLKKSIEVLSGYNEINYGSILWYSTFDDEIVISDVIEYALEHGYDKIVLEHLEDLE